MNTESSSESKYTLRFPFQVVPKRKIPKIDKPVTQKYGKLTFLLKQDDPFYIFEIEGFHSEKAAREYLNNLWIGLMWVMLNNGMAFNANMVFDTVVYSEDPYKAAENIAKNFGLSNKGRGKVDGLANGNMPIVYPSGKIVRTITGTATVTTGLNIHQVYRLLFEGLSSFNDSEIIIDRKLKTALELFNAHFYEESSNAKLLTLIMALETLTTNQVKHKVAIDFIDQWCSQVVQQKEQFKSDTDEYEALESLERELLVRKETSLRRKIRTLVYKTLSLDRNPDASRFAQRSVKIYDSRSTLVHNGHLPPTELQQALSEAKEITEMVLKIKLREAYTKVKHG